MDSSDYAADTNGIDLAARANSLSSQPASDPGLLGGNLMNRTLVVLALAAFSTAGCRAVAPYGGCGCGDSCCEPCQVECSQCAPRPDGCCEGYANQCGRGGSLDQSCLGQCCDNGGVFDRYCGPGCGCGEGGPCGCGDACACGDGYASGCCDGCAPGPYDCSACGSPYWGCAGYRHPQGYVTGQRCFCGGPNQCRPPGPVCPICGNGYCCTCCGPPAPGCCPCNSGDQNYNFAPGPPVAQTAYPYYTVRGPRDFLLDNPPSIGPY